MNQATVSPESVKAASFPIKTFKAAFDLAYKVVPSRTFKPILDSVRLTVGPKDATLEASSLDRSIRIPFACSSEGPGFSCMLDSERVKAWLKGLPKDTTHASIDVDDSTIRLTANGASVRLAVSHDASLFPVMPAWDDEQAFYSIPSEEAIRTYDLTEYATDPESSRYALGGILLEFALDGTGIAVATNGRVLARRTFDHLKVHGKKFVNDSLLIPVDAFRMARDIAKATKSPVNLQDCKPDAPTDDDRRNGYHFPAVIMKIGGITLFRRRIEGRFPRYEDCFPSEHDISVTIPAELMLEFANQAVSVSTEEHRGTQVLLRPANGNDSGAVLIESWDGDTMTFSRRLDLPVEGIGPRVVSLDMRYLVDPMKALGKSPGQVVAKVLDHRNAVSFSADNGRFNYVVMPLTMDKDTSPTPGKYVLPIEGQAMLERLDGPAPTIEAEEPPVGFSGADIDTSKADPFVRAIRNAPKKAYAQDYLAWIRIGRIGDCPERPSALSAMAAQSVRQVLDAMFPATQTDEGKARRLESLKNYRSGYEIALTNGTVRYLLCYSPAKSRDGLMRAIRAESRAELLVAFTGFDRMEMQARAADGVRIGDWHIKFTGRTEREAIIEGELPHWMDATSPVSFPETSEGGSGFSAPVAVEPTPQPRSVKLQPFEGEPNRVVLHPIGPAPIEPEPSRDVSGFSEQETPHSRPQLPVAGHIRLQGVGMVQAIRASDVKLGMMMAYNCGYASPIVGIVEASKQFLEIETTEKGKNYKRRYKKDRLVAAFWPKPAQTKAPVQSESDECPKPTLVMQPLAPSAGDSPTNSKTVSALIAPKRTPRSCSCGSSRIADGPSSPTRNERPRSNAAPTCQVDPSPDFPTHPPFQDFSEHFTPSGVFEGAEPIPPTFEAFAPIVASWVASHRLAGDPWWVGWTNLPSASQVSFLSLLDAFLGTSILASCDGHPAYVQLYGRPVWESFVELCATGSPVQFGSPDPSPVFSQETHQWEFSSPPSSSSGCSGRPAPSPTADTLVIGGTTYGLTRVADGFDLCKGDDCHRVTLAPEGPRCDCPSARFRPGPCKHILPLADNNIIPPIVATDPPTWATTQPNPEGSTDGGISDEPRGAGPHSSGDQALGSGNASTRVDRSRHQGGRRQGNFHGVSARSGCALTPSPVFPEAWTSRALASLEELAKAWEPNLESTR